MMHLRKHFDKCIDQIIQKHSKNLKKDLKKAVFTNLFLFFDSLFIKKITLHKNYILFNLNSLYLKNESYKLLKVFSNIFLNKGFKSYG